MVKAVVKVRSINELLEVISNKAKLKRSNKKNNTYTQEEGDDNNYDYVPLIAPEPIILAAPQPDFMDNNHHHIVAALPLFAGVEYGSQLGG